ncbi:MAG TPA: ring-cleaving dioxygenase [Gemmatimonadales bacterium]|nr:ring-cleaving dioxygenase [Gemmatimonadales bacterium]
MEKIAPGLGARDQDLMSMQHPVRGLHHVTATVADAQEDLDFASGVLGLRLVKRTVNFDNHSVYHFYYGDETGTPGTIWTTFPYQGRGLPIGQKGLGQLTVTSFSVPAGSLDFWRNRLVSQGFSLREPPPRFGEETLAVTDPSGLDIELVATERDERVPWTGSGVPANAGVRGLHSVTLHSRTPRLTQTLMTEMLGFHQIDETAGRVRMGTGGNEAGKLVDILDSPGAPLARNGLGTVHHVAFAIGDEDEQRRMREALIRQGLAVTDVLDRCYFHSIYFREPGGILFEIATMRPGFTIDEDLGSLGTSLKLPRWEEPNRDQIEAALRTASPALRQGGSV